MNGEWETHHSPGPIAPYSSLNSTSIFCDTVPQQRGARASGSLLNTNNITSNFEYGNTENFKEVRSSPDVNIVTSQTAHCKHEFPVERIQTKPFPTPEDVPTPVTGVSKTPSFSASYSSESLSGLPEPQRERVAFDHSHDNEQSGTDTIPNVAKRFKARKQPWALIVDENYGEGSAREHAALQPRFYGKF